MAQPGDTISRTFSVIDATGAAVTGLTTASFTLAWFRNGTSAAVTWSVTEISSGRYKLTYTLPSVAGINDAYFVPVTTTYFIQWPDLAEEAETYDFDALYGAVAKPTIVLNSTGAPSNEIELKFIHGDYHSVGFTVKNSDGSLVNLVSLGYANPKFGVKNAAQSTVGGVVPYAQTTGITFSTTGDVTLAVPETASFYGLLAAGDAQTSGARWSLEADLGGDPTKTKTLGRGVCTVMRKETE